MSEQLKYLAPITTTEFLSVGFWNEVPINVVLEHPDAKLPTKNGDEFNVGIDIYTVEDDLILFPGEGHTFHTGIRVATPPNYGFLLRERSGLGVKFDIGLGAGVIEGTYRNEWLVRLRNHGSAPVEFKKGDRICQAVLVPIIPCHITQVDSLDETQRGENGFGSSGR